MRILGSFFILIVFFLSACGGDSKETSKPAAIIIGPTIALIDSSGDGVIERAESFIFLVKITSGTTSSINGSATLDSVELTLDNYTGSLDFTHQTEFVAPAAGTHIIKVTASISETQETSSNFNINIVPNKADVIAALQEQTPNFIQGGTHEGEPLLGIATDSNDSNLGYVEARLTNQQLNHNDAPSGLCGATVPHKLVSVHKDVGGVTIPDSGLVYPLECLTQVQSNHIEQKLMKAMQLKSEAEQHYIAQNLTVTVELTSEGESLSISSTGPGIHLEGNMFDVVCGDYTLFKTNSTYIIESEDILQDSNGLFHNDSTFTLHCYRTVEYEQQIETSALLAKITGKKVEVDALAPTASINTVEFSIPYGNGGLDVGNICVNTYAEDESGYVTEALTLVSSDQLASDIKFGGKNAEGLYCLDLATIEGAYHVSQVATDGSANSTTNNTRTYEIVKNQAPVFSSALPSELSLDINQGIVTLIEERDVSDPEGHEVILTGETSIDTRQDIGEYQVTAYASDPYGAQSSKSILVKLQLPNSPPVAIPVANAGLDQTINTGTTVQLDGTSSYDDDGDVLSYQWKLVSKPFISTAFIKNATSPTPSIKVDREGEYEISLVVNDGHKNSKPSSIKLTVIEGVNPLAPNIDVLIVAADKFHGFEAENYTEVLISMDSSKCAYIGGLDIAPDGTVFSVSSSWGRGVYATDPSQPLCLKQSPQPYPKMYGLAIDSQGKFWGTSALINTGVGNLVINKLYHFDHNGIVINEIVFPGHVIFAIDFSTDGTLYGVTFVTQQLIKINTDTGETTFIAKVATGFSVSDIDIDKNNILRLWDGDTGTLYEYSLTGSLLRKIHLPSVCTLCGRTSIVTNK